MNKQLWVPWTLPAPVWAPADDPAGDPPAGDPPPADPVAGDPPAGDPPAGDPPPAARWWEDNRFSDAQRQQLTALSLTVDDPIDAVVRLADMEIAAKRKLGKPADALMDRPGKDEKIADWMRKNGDLFGIPEKAEDYKLEQPKDWPKDAEWDGELETQARAIALDEGIGGAALQRFTDLYAGRVQALMASAEQDFQAANAEMMGALQKDWGAQMQAKVAQAQQAASVVAEAAGLDDAALENLSQALASKTGDASVIRLFAAIGEMMGEDMAAGLGKGGGNALGTTPAEARAELQRQQASDGEWYKAVAANDRAAIERLKPKMDQLRKLAAG